MRHLSAFYALLLALGTAPLLAQVNPVPFVNTPLVPGAIPPGEKKFTLTVNGTGFMPGATVNWNKSARPTTYISSSRLTAEISPAEISVPKTVQVTVTNPAPGGGRSNPVPFAVTVPSSTIAFATPLTMALPYGSAVVGDFNNDGKADLAIGTLCVGQAFCMSSPTPSDRVEGMVTVFLGKGDGTFTAMPPFAVQGGPGKMVAGDFSNDGNQDLAVAQGDLCGGCAYITLFHGNGDGTFAAGVKAYTTEGYYYDMAAGDFNRDGHLDLMPLFDTIPVPAAVTLLGNGDDTFVAKNWSSGAPPFPVNSMAVGDLNRDGILDVAMNGTIEDVNGFDAYIGKGDGTFSPLQSPPLANNYSIGAPLLLGGFASDESLDIVASTLSTPNTLLTLQGNGDGTFTLINNEPLAGTLMDSVTDWNGDGLLDVASVDSEGNLNLYRGNGNGTFQPAGTPATGQIGGLVAVADFNDDGRPDIAYYNSTSGTVVVQLQTQGYAATVRPPLSPDTSKTYKAFQGSIPVIFRLSQYGDSTCILPPAKISLTKTAGTSPGVVPESLYATWPDDGKQFIADEPACEYGYNLATWSLAPGTYQIQISLYGIVVGNATFRLI